MKPLITLVRNLFVGLVWTIFFTEGVRVIMLRNWHFDIFNGDHWNYAWELWLKGIVIQTSKEWAFVLILLTFIPLLLTGWAALCLLPWERIFPKVCLFPLKIFNKIFAKQVKVITQTAHLKAVKKKKSYKEIRPRSLRSPALETNYTGTSPATTPLIKKAEPTKKAISSPNPIPQATPPMKIRETSQNTQPEKFDHSLFQFDNNDGDDDFDFDFDAFDPKPEKESLVSPKPARSNHSNMNTPKKDGPRNNKKALDKNNKQPSIQISPKRSENKSPRGSNSILDALKQKGYETLVSSTIKGTLIDFIGLSNDQICLCLVDRENGDWLADEERFNDEEPLWFSESSHRVSPVRKVSLAAEHLRQALTQAGLEYNVSPYVVVQIGNIINAEDMFEVWNNMHINVTRIDRGTPKDLQLFTKSLPEVAPFADQDRLTTLKKLIHDIA